MVWLRRRVRFYCVPGTVVVGFLRWAELLCPVKEYARHADLLRERDNGE